MRVPFLGKTGSLIFAAVAALIAVATGHGHFAPLFFMPLIGGV